jgi:uncharacterized membrane protein
MKTVILYAITTVIFFAIDMVWLGLIARNFYKQKLGFLLSANVNWISALIFYFIYIAGILYFAVIPSLKDSSWHTALLNGAFLGLVCYATYDLTNMATIDRWPLEVVIIDIIWGIVLTGSVATLTYLIAIKIL